MFDAVTSLVQNFTGGANNNTVGLRDQGLPFMFEVIGSNGFPEFTYVMPINPQVYKITEAARVTITQTQGEPFIDNIGSATPRLIMQGTFGYLGTKPGGGGKGLDKTVNKEGWALAMMCESVFLKFYGRFGTDYSYGKKWPKADPANPPEIRFYNYTDLDYFVVTIDKFDLLHSIDKRFLYQYDMQMTVTRRIDKPTISEDALMVRLNGIPTIPSLSVWGTILKAYSTAYGVVSTVINTVNSVESDLATIRGAVSGFTQGITDLIRCPFGLIKSTTDAVAGILTTISGLGNLPHEFTNDLRDTQAALLQLGLQQDNFQTTDATAPDGTIPTDIQIITVPLPPGAANMNIVAMDIPESTLFEQSAESVQAVTASQEIINDQDTMESIAARMLGNSSEWSRIAILNGLEYPFIVSSAIEAFSPPTATGQISADIPAGAKVISLDGFTAQPGDLLLIAAGDVVEPAYVESVDGNNVTFSAPLNNSFTTGTTISAREKQLSVLKPGDKINIPGDATSNKAIVANGKDDFATQLYGTDEYLDADGFQQADSSASVATLSGYDNIVMQLTHRLSTVLGSLAHLGHPQYGSYLPLIIGKIGTNYWYERALLEARLTLLNDPRVAMVDTITLQVNGTVTYLNADVYLVNQSNAQQMTILL